jgi:hypothetical protein
MSKPLEKWTVLPHGQLLEVDQGIVTVTGTLHMPLTDLPRRMTAVRLRDGRLVIYNGIALEEPAMQQLESLGVPAFLIVPGDRHRHDAKIWKERYPAMQVLAPAGAAPKVSELLAVDATEADFDDPEVTFLTVSGTGGHEAALMVRRRQGSTLVLNDLIANIRHESGFGGWLLRMMGFAGDAPHVPGIVKAQVVSDRESLRGQLLEWAADSSLRRILVSHGEPMDQNVPGALRTLAGALT